MEFQSCLELTGRCLAARRRARVVWIVAVLSALSLFAQAPRKLIGSVTDRNGTVIPAAKVTVTPTGQSTSTGSEGLYVLSLPPGAYTVKIETEGFKPVEAQVTVPADRNRFFDTVLEETTLAELVVVTTTDAASSRPGYLTSSELAPGSLFTAYGKFPANGQVEGRIIDRLSSAHPLKLVFASSTQISGIVPSGATAGNALLELNGTGGQSTRSPIRIVESRPTFFTLDQSGAGAGIFTDAANFQLVTREKPARPGGIYTAWITNAGAADNDVTPSVRDRRPFFDAHELRYRNNPFAPADILYFGPSGIPGLDQLNFRLPQNLSLGGCGVPVQLGVKPAIERLYYFGNEVTIPVAQLGGCGDRFGFAPEDRALLTGGGIGVMEGAISETTFIFSNAAQRHVTSGRLVGSLWTDSFYRPPPDESCELRWQPSGTTPAAPRAFTFGGAATMTVPWGQFAFSSTSNAGPYALTFGFPAAFTTGNYSLNLGPGFTVGGQGLSLQVGGRYVRPAGQAREFMAGRIATVPAEQRYADWVRFMLGIVGEMPGTLRAQLNTDLSLRFDHGTLGTHTVRCIGATDGNHAFMNTALESYIGLLPETANTSTAVFRFFPKDRLRFDGTGPVNRIHVNFDASLVFNDIGFILKNF